MKKIIVIITLLILTISCCFTHPNSQRNLNTQAQTQNEEVALPIVMYHSVLKSRTSKYTINPDELESDIIKYKEMGYTPVTLREVENWVKNNGVLPQKPMVITFDDGHFNNLYYALPIFKKHNVKAVINVITSFSRFASESTKDANNPNYSYLTWDNIRELHESGLVEIGNHTHAMHKFKPRYGIAQVSGETVDHYKETLRKDLETANAYLTQNAGVPQPITFAYPFGKYTNEGREILKDLGFKAMLTCNEGVSIIRRGDSQSLLSLKRYNRSGNVSQKNFMKKVFGNDQQSS